MSVEVFELHIQRSSQKLEDLWQRAERSLSISTKPSRQGDRFDREQILQESLIELSASIAELQAATATLRRQNEELIANHQLLEEERRYYQQLFRYSPDCCLVTSSNGTIAEANQNAIDLLNVPAKYLTNKSLAVFISASQLQKYYTALNQLKSGAISTANWNINIMPRHQPGITMNCMVVAIRNSKREVLNLRWRFSRVAEPQNPSSNSPSPLISAESLRDPLYNLNIQLAEIAENALEKPESCDRRLFYVKESLETIIDNVDNVYILNCFTDASRLTPSLIDYTVSSQQIVRQFQQHKSSSQQLYFYSPQSYSGICDSFLFTKLVSNLLDSALVHSPPLCTIKVKLRKKGDRMTLGITSYAPKLSLTELNKIFNSLLHLNSSYSIALNNWQLVVIQKCLTLIHGELELKSPSSKETTITVSFPAIADYSSVDY